MAKKKPAPAAGRSKKKPAATAPPAKAVPQGNAAQLALDYAARKERAREQQAEQSKQGRDIGELPAIADPQRRAAALADPELFCKTYFPLRFRKAMSDDQRQSLRDLKHVAEHGGKKAFAAPRGDGKTTRSEVMVLWAILSGLRKFVPLIGATKAAADENLESIRGEFETNELLLADFPEVCYPVHKLEGIANRCKGQLYHGEPTRMKWSGNMLVLPTIPNSPASGAVICCRGITGRVRGMKYRRPDGETVRPDMVIVDDPQTEASARSAHQVTKRLKTLTGAILGLAGPGESIACFVPCTVIEPSDLADQLLNHELHPEFQGVRTQLLASLPTNLELWDQYATIRRACHLSEDYELANKFYKKQRKQLDAGAAATWSERYDADAGELSAIQHAMNLRCDHPDTFDAEYQNQPRDTAADDDKPLTPAAIAAKTSGLPKRKIPLAATQLTAFIDVQQRLLYYAVCAWSPDFTGSCVDYGAWPDQQRSTFLYRDAPIPIQRHFPNAGIPGAIRGALDRLIEQLVKTEYEQEGGAMLRISKILIDSGNWADVIYQCCRESPHAALLVPSKGKGITSDRAPISEWKRHEGQIVGEEWMLGRVENKRATRLLTYDTHFWKTRLHTGLSTAVGDRGAFTLYGPRGQGPGARSQSSQFVDHSMIAAHITAETRKKTEGGGRVVYVYALKPEKPDNHLLDCVVGNHVAASLLGCRLIGTPLVGQSKPKPRARQRVSALSC